MNRLTAFAALTTSLACTLTAADGEACGGCFHVPNESTVVTGHRMALSVSPTQAVLWDQVRYEGNPSEFSWVLPIRPGATIDVASDAFFDVLEAGTLSTVASPPEGCAASFGGGDGSGDVDFGCGSDDFASAAEDGGFISTGSGFGAPTNQGGVNVVHEGTVGPYDTVTLSTEDPDALVRWLDENGFVLPDSILPIIDDYVAEGFDFIALKLSPGQNTRSMAPVRVTTPGSGYTLPLRMVAAGVGASVDLVLYVIGEGRYQAGSDFANTTILPNVVTWDFLTDRSNYAELRLASLDSNEGRSWLTTYARNDPFLSAIGDGLGNLNYQIDGSQGFGSAQTLAGAYFLQGEALGDVSLETMSASGCIGNATSLAGDMGVVTDLCNADGTECRTAQAGEIDRNRLACGDLDDIAVALTGLHPGDVYLTRMEASLPPEMLNTDLRIEAADEQREVSHRFTAGLRANACWDQEPADAGLFSFGGGKGNGPKLPPGGMITLLLGGAALLLASRRRRAGELL